LARVGLDIAADQGFLIPIVAFVSRKGVIQGQYFGDNVFFHKARCQYPEEAQRDAWTVTAWICSRKNSIFFSDDPC
jgi:hypothetical protein